jgi:hypothetical protein
MGVALVPSQCSPMSLIIKTLFLLLFPKEIRPNADVIAGGGEYLDGSRIRIAQRIILTAMHRLQTFVADIAGMTRVQVLQHVGVSRLGLANAVKKNALSLMRQACGT